MFCFYTIFRTDVTFVVWLRCETSPSINKLEFFHNKDSGRWKGLVFQSKILCRLMIKQDMGKPYFHTNAFFIGLMKNPDLKTFVIQVFSCLLYKFDTASGNLTSSEVMAFTGQPSSRWRDLAGAAACVGLKAKSQRKYPGGNQRKGQWSTSRSISIQNSENKIHNGWISTHNIITWRKLPFGVVLFVIHVEHTVNRWPNGFGA